MDLLASGPERPPGEGGLGRLLPGARRRLRALDPRAAPWRRRAVAAVVALALAGAVPVLRSGLPQGSLQEPYAADESLAAGPVIIYGRPRLQPPPFDRLPGRTPIPQAWPVGRDGRTVRGRLPSTGAGPGERAVRDAAGLVLGRYCRHPRAYLIQLDGRQGWQRASAYVLRRVSIGPRRVATLRLRWMGQAYVWQGSQAELADCS